MAKKLIEVAIPLKAINLASAREKSIRHGHPSTLHLWWARRPLAAARAVIFAQMVDDPSSHPELFPTKEAQDAERLRLFQIMEKLVEWENTTNQDVINAAQAEIKLSWRRTCEEYKDHPQAATLFDPDILPGFHDPFAGGGAIPLEAQRLGFESYASDLNPVAVLINKAMIEIPPKFSGMSPVNPESQNKHSVMAKKYHGAEGLAEDVRYYGTRMREEAAKKIGSYYPPIEITPEMAKDRPDLQSYVGRSLTVIAYLWARTVKSPNPAFAHIDVPLVSSFALSTKKGKEAYVDPVIRPDNSGYDLVVRIGGKSTRDGTVERSGGGTCLMSGTTMPFTYLREEGISGRMGARLMTIVCEGDRGRVYLSPTEEQEMLAKAAQPAWKPELNLPEQALGFRVQLYGMNTFGDLFTPRQLLALTTFSDLLPTLRDEVLRDAKIAGVADDGKGIEEGGRGSKAYAEGVSTYLAFMVDKCADYWSSIASWSLSRETVRNTFGRQAIPMNWDYAETNPFSTSTGNWTSMCDWTWKALAKTPGTKDGDALQIDAQSQMLSENKVISTDPPYYDNIGYADLSDFFYVWLRKNLRETYPSILATVAVPKAEELVATPYRHGSKSAAEAFFMEGMTKAMERIAQQSHPGLPVTIYYAFKQSETDTKSGTASTGWETFLEAVVKAGFEITGTWPMRTELANRMVGLDTNALASSIVLVCRQRNTNAPIASRSEFLARLRQEFPKAFSELQGANIAPVDLAQSAIGPGMAIYTSYSAVENLDGSRLSVREALTLINQTLDEVLSEQEGDFDSDTRWAISWFEQFAFETGDFGEAETLSKAKNTSVTELSHNGILTSATGKVRLLPPSELSGDFVSNSKHRISAWADLHYLIKEFETSGEGAAAVLLRQLGARGETARELAYRLYTVAERKGRSSVALSYNALIQSLPEISRLAQSGASTGSLISDDGLFS